MCVIPLSLIAKRGQKYGVVRQKIYNDAARGVLEKYGLVVEEVEGNKAVVLENEEQIDGFLRYFVEEFLGKGEEERKKIVYEGVPLEKYEQALREIAELREEVASLKKEREEFKEKLEEKGGELFRREKETEKLKKELEEKEKEIKDCKENLKELQIRPIIEELTKQLGKEGEEKLKKLINALRGE